MAFSVKIVLLISQSKHSHSPRSSLFTHPPSPSGDTSPCPITCRYTPKIFTMNQDGPASAPRNQRQSRTCYLSPLEQKAENRDRVRYACRLAAPPRVGAESDPSRLRFRKRAAAVVWGSLHVAIFNDLRPHEVYINQGRVCLS